MLASSRGPCAGANLAGRRKSSAPRRRGVRRSDAPGDPERYLRGKAPHPSVCACGASTSPCRGGFFTAVSQRRPCKGSCRRQPTEGCIAARRQRYPAKAGRPLPRIRRGRCSHRPASFPAAAAFSGPMKNHRPLRRLGAARKDTGKGNAAMHPSVCACGASTSPCRGGFFTAVSQRRPCKGSCRRQPTEGCIAARRQRYPAKPGRPLPRIRRGRCSHRPAACPRRRQRGLMQASLPARAAQTSRRRKAPARCRTPPSPSVTPPLAGEAFLKAVAQGGHAAPAPPPLLHTCGTNRTFSQSFT